MTSLARLTMPYFGMMGARVACPHSWGGERIAQWHSLRAHWEWLTWIAEQRDAQKRTYSSSRYMNARSHFIGLCGELVFALEFGLAIDSLLRTAGDGGTDFDRVDIKTATYFRDPYLKHPVNARHWPPWFALVALDEGRKHGQLVGVASGEMVRQAPTRDWGHGPQHSIAGQQLLNVVPRDICRFCGGRNTTPLHDEKAGSMTNTGLRRRPGMMQV